MRKISHITINTGNTVEYEATPVVMKGLKTTMNELIRQVMEKGQASVLDGTIIQLEISDDYTSYAASLCFDDDRKTTIVKSLGAITQESGEWMLATANMLYVMFCGGTGMNVGCQEAPLICDVVYPTIEQVPQVKKWFSEFTKCLGIEMLKMLEVKHNESDSIKFVDFTVGKVYKEAIGHPDGVLFDVDDCGILVKVYMSRPTLEELEQFDVDKSFQMKLVELRNIIFPLFKFGNLNWMDAPYCVHLSRNLSGLEVPSEGYGWGMHISLYDTKTGTLCKNKLIGLSTKMTKDLIEMIKKQYKKPFNVAEYDANLQMVYAAYPTKALVKMATSSFKLEN